MATPSRAVPAALFLTLLLKPLAGFCEDQPRGVTAVIEGKTTIGWTLDGNLAKSITGEDERHRFIDDAVRWVAGRMFSGDGKAERLHKSDSIAAFLKEQLVHKKKNFTAQVFFESGDKRLLLNKYYSGKLTQLVGRFEPALSGIGTKVSDEGLTVLYRFVGKPADAEAPLQLYQQYFGARIVEWTTSTVEIEEDLLRRDVLKNVYVTVWDRTKPISSAVRLKKDVITVYSEAAGLGRLANIVSRAGGGALGIIPTPVPQLACAGADLSDQFPDGPTRNQGSVGNCHVFPAVALLENGLRKAYGVNIALSEQDLYETFKNVSEETLRASIPLYEIASLINGKSFLGDGGFSNMDLVLAKLKGVATRKTVPYRNKSQDGGDPYEKVAKKIGEVIGGIGGGSGPPPVPAAAVLTAGEEREIMAKAFKAFSLTHRFYTPLDAGFSQKYEMIKHLCAGRPLAVGMNIRGLEGFRAPNNDSKLVNTIKTEGHAFAIVGFERRSVGGKEKYVFKTRNSWGGINPDIAEDELWRLMAIASLKAVKRKPPEGLAALAGKSPVSGSSAK